MTLVYIVQNLSKTRDQSRLLFISKGYVLLYKEKENDSSNKTYLQVKGRTSKSDSNLKTVIETLGSFRIWNLCPVT